MMGLEIQDQKNKFTQSYYQNFDRVWRVWNHQVTQFLS